MGKVDFYLDELSKTTDVRKYLLENSGLPGKRGNLELMFAFKQNPDEELIKEFITIKSDAAPENTPESFLAFCGVSSLGMLIISGKNEYHDLLRQASNDSRWRIREAVAFALQDIGRSNIPALLNIVLSWASGSDLEQRAAAAGLCESELFIDKEYSAKTLEILDRITRSILSKEDRKSDCFRALRKGLGYCWSVAIAAYPAKGKKVFEKLMLIDDKDIKWIIRENLKKNRLKKMDGKWVADMQASL